MKRNAKHTAAISLGVMGAGFAAAFPIAHAPLGFVLQSGFEAGLVGGLADWFAVTALFRHPLGIPIPHTALLPKNRDKVTNALVNAIQTNLLNKESIIEKTKSARLAERAVQRVRQELDKESAAAAVSALLSKLLAEANPEKLAAFLAPGVRQAIRSVDATALLRRLGETAIERGYEADVFDVALDWGERFAATGDMRRRMGATALRSLSQVQLGGFMGFAVGAFAGFMNEEKLGGMLQDFILSFLSELRQPGNPYREAALAGMRDAASRLADNERVVSEAERWKSIVAERPETEAAIAQAVRTALDAFREKAADPAYCERAVVPALRGVVDSIAKRTDWLERADEWIRGQAAAWVEKNHGLIGQLVKENADKLDNETLIEMVEEHVGKDLQWIRVNGAVCGFAIGLVLGTIQWFAGVG